MAYSPERGDVIYLNFPEEAGHEQAGRRPAFVLSHSRYNSKVGLAVVCPMTNQIKGYPFEVPIPPGQPVTGVILADQIQSVDWDARDSEYKCHLPEEIIMAVLEKLAFMLWD